MHVLAVWVVAIAAFVAAQFGLRPAALAERATWPPGDESKVLILEHAAPILGRELTADILWAQTIVYYGGARYGGVSSDFRYLRPYLDAVLDVDPHYKRVYRWAAYSVTHLHGAATREEYLESLRYLERAMEVYPDDHLYPWMAGSRYFLDLRSDDPEIARRYKERGVELIERAMRKPGAPPNYSQLAAAFRTKLGQQERALANLREMILTTDDPKAREQLILNLRGAYQATDLADELEQATKELEQSWRANMPFAPPTFFFLVGERPSPVIEFDDLATERDLFGAEEPEPEVSDPLP